MPFNDEYNQKLRINLRKVFGLAQLVSNYRVDSVKSTIIAVSIVANHFLVKSITSSKHNKLFVS